MRAFEACAFEAWLSVTQSPPPTHTHTPPPFPFFLAFLTPLENYHWVGSWVTLCLRYESTDAA